MSLRKQRNCLKCGKAFMSQGPGNRLCRACNRENSQMTAFAKALAEKQRGAQRHNGEIIRRNDDTDPLFLQAG